MGTLLESGRYFGQMYSVREVSGLQLSETGYTPHSSIPEHQHKNGYICFVIKGHYYENTNAKKYNCRNGDMIFHPPSFTHSNQFLDTPVRCFNVEITEKSRQDIQSSFKKYDSVIFENQYLKNVIQKIYREFRDPDIFSDMIIEGLILEVMGYSSRERQRKNCSYWSAKVRNIINGNNCLQQSLTSIAGELQISKSYLARAFKKETGTSIGNYAREIIIQKACDLLRTGNAEIVSISYDLGFIDQSHFTKTFKKVMGITPGQYLKAKK